VGGGSLPEAQISSIALAFETPFADELSESLRRFHPPIVTRIENNRVILDLRTIAPPQDAIVVRALAEIAT
jgi:L-seryl-tRNA(Ser) seleniumtransferase